jgi:predicted metal-dependent HD superfamily phosphohydrolase
LLYRAIEGRFVSLIDEDTKAELIALYSAPDRHYHGLAHIGTMLALAGEYRTVLSDPEAVEAAIWFHDAVYDSRRSDNETRSAELAVCRLSGRTDRERLDLVGKMIEATATHQVPELATKAARMDAAFFLDMDLSVLGASPDQYDSYEEAIRREYAWVAGTAWRSGRTAVLKNFLSRSHIYHSNIFRSRYETQARENMARSLARLA